jgi:hypothetical protein
MPLKVIYENRPCIWDAPRRRLVRPRDVFAEPVPYFEPHKVRVNVEATVAAGLDVLGRRLNPGVEDYAEFLRLLAAFRDGSGCSDTEQAQAISALEQVGRANGTNIIDADIPVLTQTGRMLPLEEVFKMDAPFWSRRFADTDVEFIHAHVAAPRILKAARGISEAAQEILEAEPLPSRDRDTEAACFRLQTLIRSGEFSGALVRLASHERGYRLAFYNPSLAEFQVCPAVEIRTVLELERDGEIRRVGSHNVDFFVDGDSQKVWIAARAVRGVRPKMAKAINRLMGEFGLRDLAPLEAILRVSKEHINLELDDRGIMSWDLSDRPRPDWSTVPDESAESAYEGTDPDTPFDEVEAGSQRDMPDTEPSTTPGATLAPNSSEPQSGDEVGIRDEDKPTASPTEGSATAVASRTTGHLGVAIRGSSQGPHRRGSSGGVPMKPRAGESSGRAAANSIDQGIAPAPTSQDSKTGPDGTSPPRGPRGRYVTYVVPDDTADPSSESEGGSEHERNMEISRAAVARVLEFERSQGRLPKEMPHLNPGYDVESLGPNGEVMYIEVKGIDGPWDAAGVRLSAIQFRFAEQRAESAWLYIVEWARDDDQARIHRIQNPANKVTVFCFDQGWRAVAGKDAAARSLPSETDANSAPDLESPR